MISRRRFMAMLGLGGAAAAVGVRAAESTREMVFRYTGGTPPRKHVHREPYEMAEFRGFQQLEGKRIPVHPGRLEHDFPYMAGDAYSVLPFGKLPRPFEIPKFQHVRFRRSERLALDGAPIFDFVGIS